MILRLLMQKFCCDVVLALTKLGMAMAANSRPGKGGGKDQAALPMELLPLPKASHPSGPLTPTE